MVITPTEVFTFVLLVAVMAVITYLFLVLHSYFYSEEDVLPCSVWVQPFREYTARRRRWHDEQNRTELRLAPLA